MKEYNMLKGRKNSDANCDAYLSVHFPEQSSRFLQIWHLEAGTWNLYQYMDGSIF
jgi:hypothetical protein